MDHYAKAYPIFSRIRGYRRWNDMLKSLRKYTRDETAQKRMEMITFYDQFGEKATIQAFGADRRVISRWKKRLACIVAITGLWIMTGGIHQLNIGDWITFGTAIAIAIYITISAIAVKNGANPLVLTFHQMWVTAALGGITALLLHSQFYTPNYSVYISMLYLGIFASAIGFLIQNIMLKKVNLIIASILLGTEPLFALIFSWILKYEPIHVTKIIGGLVIFSAIILPDIIKKLKKTMLNKLRLK